MSAILEIQFNEFNNGQCAMYLKLRGNEPTEKEVKAARKVIDLLSLGAIASGAEEIVSKDFEKENPIINGKN
jgi:hypothetical protein